MGIAPVYFVFVLQLVVARIAWATSGSESNENTFLCAPLCDKGNSSVSSNSLAHFRIGRPPCDAQDLTPSLLVGGDIMDPE
jgi:hypothetical protein